MSVVQTVLVFVIIPAVIYGAIALLIVGRRIARRPRYRSGQPWDYEPRFWTANPEGAHLPSGPGAHGASEIAGPGTAGVSTGGARGHW